MKAGAREDRSLGGRIGETSSEKPMKAEGLAVGYDTALDEGSRVALEVNGGVKTLSRKYPWPPLGPPAWPR